MNRLLTLLLLACALVIPASARRRWVPPAVVIAPSGFAMVDHAVTGSSNGNNVTTASFSTVGANLIIIAVGFDNFGALPVISCNHGGDSITAKTQYNASGAYGTRTYFILAPTSDAAYTVTATAAFSFPTVGVISFSGAKNSAPSDQENGNGATSATSQNCGVSGITPSEDNELVVAILAHDNTNTAAIDGSGFTLYQIAGDGSNHTGVAIAWKIQTTASPEDRTFSWTGSTAAATAITSYKKQ